MPASRPKPRFACLHLPPAPTGKAQDNRAILTNLAESLGPDYEIRDPNTAIVDLSCAPLPESWNPGIPGLRTALAEHPDLAHLAAVALDATCGFPKTPLQPADLDPLPLHSLLAAGFPGAELMLPTLQLWGLHTIGEFRALPRQQTAERLGPHAMRIHDLLHLKLPPILNLHRPIQSFVQIIEFDDSIDSTELLLFQVKRALQILCNKLQSLHLAAAKLRFNLLFQNDDELGKSIQLPEPRSSLAGLMGPLQTAWEQLRIPSPVTALELELEPVKSTAAQREWLGRQIHQPERWGDTLGRLESMLGADRVGIAVPDDNHRPDSFRVVPAMQKSTSLPEVREVPACPLPLRRFRPPLEVAVAGIRRADGSPEPQALLTGPHAGPIIGKRGPFPSSGDWWSPKDAWQRLEWDIQMESRHLLRLTFRPPNRWQIDGLY